MHKVEAFILILTKPKANFVTAHLLPTGKLADLLSWNAAEQNVLGRTFSSRKTFIWPEAWCHLP